MFKHIDFSFHSFTIFVIVIKTKRHIALILSSLAMLALLLHGTLPHHHHDSENEKCGIEEHLNLHSQSNSGNFNSYCITSCCEDHQSNAEQAHVCNLNVEASKQISLELIAVIQSFTFQNYAKQVRLHFLPKANLFTSSLLYEVLSLRAPPLA